MNKSSLNGVWGQLRQKYGIYLRLLEALPEDKIGAEVVPGMRTPAELVAHTSGGIVRDFARGVARGEITKPEGESEIASRIGSRDEMLAFARSCWDDANAAMAQVGDDELTRMVKTPWGIEFPGSTTVHILNDEFVHHRGQLYAYVRTCGVEPPPLWSYEKNPPGFGPSA